MTTLELWLAGAGVAGIGAFAVDAPRPRHIAGLIAGLLGIGAWWEAEAAPLMGLVAFAVAATASFRLAIRFAVRARSRFSVEEEVMRETVLATLPSPAARHLLDQGLWLDGCADEVLIREGAPVPHLFYLAQGAARVTVHGAAVAVAHAPAFLGEATVLDEGDATATVTLAGPARFWCVPAAALRRFLRENPETSAALAKSFVGAVAVKLRAANAGRAETG